MEYWNNILCISAHELIQRGIVSRANYNALVNRNKIAVVRRGGGAQGNFALVAVDSLPLRLRLKLEGIESSNKAERVKRWLKSNYSIDTYASSYFGRQKLSLKDKMEYIAQASILYLCLELYHDEVQWKKIMGNKFDWNALTQAVNDLSEDYLYHLPHTTARLREKMRELDKDCYSALISGKYGNQNAKK